MRLWTGVATAIVFFWIPGLALGYNPVDEFSRGTIVATPQIGGGINNTLDTRHTKITQVSATVRVSLLPLHPLGTGFWRGSLETGLEPWFQYYPEQEATAEGLKMALRYHFLGVSPVFPYVEALAGGRGV